jgi:hypothetical protein
MSRAASLAFAQELRMEVAETCSEEAGALSDFFPHREGAGNNLDLILGAAAAIEQRKTNATTSERVSKP